MKIADRDIRTDSPPYIVAEISGNHGGVLDNAVRLIKAAKRAGADAVKTQCYDPDSLTIDVIKPDFIIQGGLWRGRTLYELYRKAHTPPAWHKELYSIARSEGITIFSSVFDSKGVDLLEGLGCPAYKIASFEIVDLPLIEYAAKTGKPLIISTGMANDREILEAEDASGQRAAFLHCTSDYPAKVEDARLHRMLEIYAMLHHGKEHRIIGISDHTLGSIVPVAATTMGALIIEKHLKLGMTIIGNEVPEDAAFSLIPADFKEMVNAVLSIWKGMQNKETPNELRQLRRSLYAVQDIKQGEQYTLENIRSIRPGYGLPPKMLPVLLGRASKRSWRRGDPLS